MEDKCFYTSGFIQKFIDINKDSFNQLSLTRVQFKDNLIDFNFLNKDSKIESITINDCNLNEDSLSQLIRNCSKVLTLKELRIIRMQMSAQNTEDIQRYLSKHKSLTLLDLSHCGITNMLDISSFLIQNQAVQSLILTGNQINSVENLRFLGVGMAQNLSVIRLEFDVKTLIVTEGFQELIDKKEIEILNLQTKLNNFIQFSIMQIQSERKNKNSNRVDLSKTNLDGNGNIEAAIKYFRIQQKNDTKKTQLSFSECRLNDLHVQAMVSFLQRIPNLELDELDLSFNNLTDFSCEYIGTLLANQKRIKKINLSRNGRIGTTGFKNFVKTVRKHTKIESLDFSSCNIDLLHRNLWIPVLDDLAANCSLIYINLDNNQVDGQFLDKVQQQLLQNRSIAEIIVPQLIKKQQNFEVDHKRRKQTLNFDPRLKNIKGTGTINLGKFNRNQARDAVNSLKPTRQKNAINFEGLEFGDGSRGSDSIIFTDEISRSRASIHAPPENQNIQKLVLRGKNLTSLDFLSKFMRENPNIGDIDIGENPLNDREIQKFTQNIKKNTGIRTIDLDGIKGIKAETKQIILEELKKNGQIHAMIKSNITYDGNSLNLKKQQIQKLGFLSKFLQGYQDLRVLDLTDNKLGNRGAIEICELIKTTKTVEVLNLQNNRIGEQGLQHMCSALVQNESIRVLDIRDNIIPDESLKTLLAMLYRNQTIQNIKYSVINPENIDKIKEFNKLRHLPIAELEQELAKSEHHHELSWKEKICLPLWCWKSFIHDKHEAFRFKYDTKALNIIEDELMDQMTSLLYLNSFVYYIIMFVCPVVFVEECNGGINMISHYIYVAYSLATIWMEVWCVLKIQGRIKNENILKFNKWHAMEIFMGLIARFDTYLDVCFFCMLFQCGVWNLVIPIGIFILIYITYPLFKLVSLFKLKEDYFLHTLPKIERNCNLCFIRENMLLATVLDSFCIANSAQICKKPIHLGRQMGVWTFLTQDGPQYFIHMLFIFVVHTEVSHSDTTVIMSLIVSTFAVNISLFNCIMCSQNEFDPVLLQVELKKRSDKKVIREQQILQQKEALKQAVQNLLAGNQDNTNLATKKSQAWQRSRGNVFSSFVEKCQQNDEIKTRNRLQSLLGSPECPKKGNRRGSLVNLSVQKKMQGRKQNARGSLKQSQNQGEENTTVDLQDIELSAPGNKQNDSKDYIAIEDARANASTVKQNHKHLPALQGKQKARLEVSPAVLAEGPVKNLIMNSKSRGGSGAKDILDMVLKHQINNQRKNGSINQQGSNQKRDDRQLRFITEEAD